MKIAPRLQTLILTTGAWTAREFELGGEEAELRALLAVARAAQRVAREKLQPRPPFTTLDRALARLEKASKP